MAEKQVTMVVCDFPHKRDRAAVGKVTIDVCGQHAVMFEGLPAHVCPECGRPFGTAAGLRKHLTDTHGAEPSTTKARTRRNTR